MAKEIREVYIKVSSNTQKEFSKGEKSAKGLAGGLKGVQGAAMAATGGIRAMTAALLSSGVGAIVVALGSLVAIMRGSLNASRDFAEGLSRLKGITGASAEDMALLSQNARDLGKSTAFTARQVVELQTEFSKLGFTTDEILATTEATLALAAASGTDLAQAAVVAGNTIRGFGLSANETQRVVDVMAKSFTTSALDIFKFQESMKLVAPIAKTTKVSIEQASAALAVLADRGVSGSLAGTQLRRIMSDLAVKTGKNFQDSLEITAERLENATGDAEKLAIAKELVGDRAKGSLIALAENREQLLKLTDAYKNAGGAAQKMADENLNNLNGDLIKMKSAWEGFLLSLDDGDGVLNKTGRVLTQALTATIGGITDGAIYLGEIWKPLMEMIATEFKVLANRMTLGANKLMMGLAQVPLLGGAVNQAKLAEQRVVLEEEFSTLMGNYENIAVIHHNAMERIKEKRLKREQELEAKAILETSEFEESVVEETNDKAITARQAFLEKLKKMEEDAEDKTEAEKLERKKQRHIAELEKLEMDETEKGELRARIAAYYDGLIANHQAKTQSEAYAKNIDDYDKMVATQKKEKEDQAKEEKRLQGEVLDSLANVFGQETAMFKAVHAVKMALKIKELLLEAGIIKAKAAADQTETVQKAQKGAAEAMTSGKAWRIAAAVAAVAAITAASIRSMKKTKGAADQMAAKVGGSASGGGAASAPSFNIIGGTSAGEQLIASQVANANSKPVKAYVVENDITTAQEMARKVKTAVTL